MEQLKPCPFCGKDAKMIKDEAGIYKIFCTGFNCDAQMGWSINKQSLANEWNRRVNDATK